MSEMEWPLRVGGYTDTATLVPAPMCGSIPLLRWPRSSLLRRWWVTAGCASRCSRNVGPIHSYSSLPNSENYSAAVKLAGQVLNQSDQQSRHNRQGVTTSRIYIDTIHCFKSHEEVELTDQNLHLHKSKKSDPRKITKMVSYLASRKLTFLVGFYEGHSGHVVDIVEVGLVNVFKVFL